MVEYVKISPLTRLEGHLGITARINDGKVSAAYSHGEMFRGFEKILIGRDPRDAPVITSRTCGVCHFVHRHTSLRNIENAAGWAFPMPQAADTYTDGKLTENFPGYLYSDNGTTRNGNPRWIDPDRTKNRELKDALAGDKLPLGAQFARNIVHLITYIYSHAAHTIALAAPDYKWYIDKYVNDNCSGLSSYFDVSTVDSSGNIDKSGATGSFFDAFYKEAVVAQRILHEMLGFLGGKAPHQQSAIPGGFSRSFKGGFTGGVSSPSLDGGTDLDAIGLLATKTIATAGVDPSTAVYGYGYTGPGPNKWPLLDLTGGLDAKKNIITANDWIAKRAALFTVALAAAGIWAGADTWGEGSNNFVCAPTFDIITVDGVGNAGATEITGDAYFRGGVKDADGNWYGLDPTQFGSDDTEVPGSGWMFIYEDITSGKYPEYDDFTEEPKCGGTAKYPKLGYPGYNDTHPMVAPEASRYTYTWYKATRAATTTDGTEDNLRLYAVESGPHGRLVVNGCDPHLNLSAVSGNLPVPNTSRDPNDACITPTISANTGLRELFNSTYSGAVGEWKSSTWNRLISRIQDILLLLDMLIGSNYSGENNDNGYLKEIHNNKSWLTRLDAAIEAHSDTYGLDSSLLVADPPKGVAWENLNGDGCGYWDAPRGITCHFSQIEDGLLTQYQHIAGTTWNGNGRDQQGNPGPFEWSLMGMLKVEDTDGNGESDTLPGENTSGENLKLAHTSGGNFVLEDDSLDGTPVCERTVLITYELERGGSWTRYYATDVPKHDESEEGRIDGEGLKATSKINYMDGSLSLDFKYNYDAPDYSHIRDVRVIRYGYANNPVLTPPEWANNGYSGEGFGYSTETGYPNPINILRTIRSYDPCLACSIHVVDKKGKVGKYEAVPVAGWEVK